MSRISMEIGNLNDQYPMNTAHCKEMLTNVCYIMARGTIPYFYINTITNQEKLRIRIKRLRERMITFGYQLIRLLDQAVNDDISTKDLLWRHTLMTTSTQFVLSSEQLHDFILAQKENDK